ncbi:MULTISPECIES: helix-turn-helix domain-containing protein [Virgibacillus]|nr:MULTISPECIES: helix-turn-helix domain-containing protein [Virgibacillus]MED3735581.1 helix-turn-helix domain-containing protein [Virgibacillus pantothenticus]
MSPQTFYIELAERCHVSRQTINAIENDK